MARLPQPGGDRGDWGNILNDFLSTAHNNDGSLKSNSVTTSTITNGAVTLSKIAVSNAPTDGQTLGYDGSALTWFTPTSSGSVADASTTVKGLVQLAGDLGGTSAAPTVPGLASKANAIDVVNLTGNQSIAGVKNFTGTLQVAGAALVNTNDARLTNERVPTNGSVVTAKIADDAVTGAKIGDNVIATNHINDGNITGGKLADNAVTTAKITNLNVTGAKIADGNITTVKIADANVTTVKIADSNVTTAKIADSSITEPKLAISNTPTASQVLSWSGSALTWTTPASSGGGGTSWTAINVTANHTATNGQFVVCDTTSQAINVTLPAPTAGAFVTVKKQTNNGNGVLVLPPSGQISAGSFTSVSITVNGYGQVADFLADGTTWHQVG